MTRRILAFDDSPSVRKLVEFTLKRDGFLVTTAQDGQEALEIVVKDAFDLIILDINMPRLDGLEFLRRIKAEDSLVAIPVVVLTTENYDKDKDEAIKLGAIAYIAKPFKPTALLELVKDLTSG